MSSLNSYFTLKLMAVMFCLKEYLKLIIECTDIESKPNKAQIQVYSHCNSFTMDKLAIRTSIASVGVRI